MGLKKNKNEELLILGLLFLALFGKGSLAAPQSTPGNGNSTPDDTSTTSNGNGSGGNNSSDDSSGLNTKSAPDADSNPTYANGVPDKSQNMSPPGTMPSSIPSFMMPIMSIMDNAGVMFAQMQTALINAGKSMSTPISNGLSFIANLGGTPDASVTTAVFDASTGMYEEYTNNQYLLPTIPASKVSVPAIPEMIKQPMPPMMMLAPAYIPLPMISTPMPIMPPSIVPPTPPMLMIPGMPIKGINLVDPNAIPIMLPGMPIQGISLVDPNVLPQKMVVPPLMIVPPGMLSNIPMLPSSSPVGNTNVPNPLANAPMGNSLLQMILNEFGGFGQDAIANLMSNGIGLQGLFNNIQGLAIPGSTISAPELLPDLFA